MENGPVMYAVEACQLRAVSDFEVDGLLLCRGGSPVFLVVLIGVGLGVAGEVIRPDVLVIAVAVNCHFIFLYGQAFIESRNLPLHLRTLLPAPRTGDSEGS